MMTSYCMSFANCPPPQLKILATPMPEFKKFHGIQKIFMLVYFPFQLIKNIAVPGAEERTFLSTTRVRGQGQELELQGQGPQYVS